MGVSRSKAGPWALVLADRADARADARPPRARDRHRAPPAAPSRASRAARAPPRWRGCGRRAPGGGRCRARATIDGYRGGPERSRYRTGVRGRRGRGSRRRRALCGAYGGGAGRAVALVSRSPLAETASYWAQGVIAAALAEDDSPQLSTMRTPSARRATLPAQRRDRALRGVARPCSRPRAAGRALRRRPAAATSRSASRVGTPGAGSHAGGSHGSPDHATCRRSWPCTSDRGARAGQAPPAARRPLRFGLLAERRAGGFEPIAARGTILRPGMAALWQRTTNPPKRWRRPFGSPTQWTPTWPTWSSSSSTPRHSASDGDRDGFLITEAVRGEGATLLGGDGERFVDERLASADQVALAVQAELERSGVRAVCLDMRHVDVERFSNIVAALADEGIDPRRDLRPLDQACCPLRDGRDRHEPGRPGVPARALRGGRVRLQRPAWGQPASVELAGRVLVFKRRAALAACDEPDPSADHGAPPEPQVRSPLHPRRPARPSGG